MKPSARRSWLYALLVAVGALAVATVLGVLFLGIGREPQDLHASGTVPPPQSPDFAVALSRLVGAPVERGGSVEALNNGDGFLPALLRDLEAAQSSINFSVYIWEDGELSERVLAALIRKQRQGVAVRVLLDGFGGLKAPDETFAALREAGGRVEQFRPPGFGTWMRIHRRNHRRAIVIDGRVGFTGGMAIKDVWLGDAGHPDRWRDVMFRLTGPLASSLQGAFVDAWAGASGEILVGPELYPVDAARDDRGVERFVHYIRSPADDDHGMAYFFLLSVLAARERLYVATPYFIPDEPLKRALADRARHGVDVRLLLPGPHIDARSVRLSGQNHYDELLAAGVRIYEYQPTFMHAKYAVVDGRWSIVGSPNLNSRSRHLDEENVFGILDAGLGGRLERIFDADLRQSAPIRLDAWRQRGHGVRLLQFAARVLDQQS